MTAAPDDLAGATAAELLHLIVVRGARLNTRQGTRNTPGNTSSTSTYPRHTSAGTTYRRPTLEGTS
ncbi:hypothetical protein OG455_19785 [Kitasatospora sp. NBC_01287]|uniref:hypothetical protein n=1 Tax=Kitasatospora sp. NBC_01287 TaxID=2903573 RepID=UPI0022540E3C|nr:hypothetical protein [Kitasatospora sp. NBC_01287]MCX4747728.1 hypothetical protein [Kitasatospora sp. NBC_01287]